MPNSQKRPKLVARPLNYAETAGGWASESGQKFRDLALGALEKQQLERAKAARVLHDEVAPTLTGAGLQLDILRMDLEGAAPGIASRTREIQDLLDSAIRQIRDLSYQLSSDLVARVGLQPALDRLIERFQKSFQGSLRLTCDTPAQISLNAAIAIERIAEEAVGNAIRHARCKHIEIIVRTAGKSASLQVCDDGTGFDYDLERRSPRGLGLSLMVYWASQAGLRFSVNSSSGQGAAVIAAMPDRNLEER